MSIALMLAQTGPTPAPAPLTPATLIWLAVVAGAAMTVAWMAGVFRRGSVAGPARLEANDPARPVWAVFLLAMLMWVFVPSIYGTARATANEQHNNTGPPAATSSATAPVKSGNALSPREVILVGSATAFIVLATLIAGDVFIFPNGLRRLGLRALRLPRGVAQAAVAIVIVLPLMYVVAIIVQSFWQVIGFEHPNAHQLLRLVTDETDVRIQIAALASAIVLAPAFEEILFRGHLQTALLHTLRSAASAEAWRSTGSDAASRWLAVIVTSIIFTSVHGELWLMPPIFFLSLCLGYAYERTGNLWVPILIHSAFNAANVIAFLIQHGLPRH